MADNLLILIVDDDVDWSDVLGMGLQRMGYQTLALQDTASARAWLATNRPALILLDVMMPGGNGLDLCRWIRAQQELAHIPVIINSGIKDEGIAELALELGAMDFLHKPVKLATLKLKIEQLLVPKI